MGKDVRASPWWNRFILLVFYGQSLLAKWKESFNQLFPPTFSLRPRLIFSASECVLTMDATITWTALSIVLRRIARNGHVQATRVSWNQKSWRTWEWVCSKMKMPAEKVQRNYNRTRTRYHLLVPKAVGTYRNRKMWNWRNRKKVLGHQTLMPRYWRGENYLRRSQCFGNCVDSLNSYRHIK